MDSVERSSLRRWTMSKISVLNITLHYDHNPLKLDRRQCLYCDVHITTKHPVHLVVRQFFIILTNSEFQTTILPQIRGSAKRDTLQTSQYCNKVFIVTLEKDRNLQKYFIRHNNNKTIKNNRIDMIFHNRHCYQPTLLSTDSTTTRLTP
jgi:hypothetical protein